MSQQQQNITTLLISDPNGMPSQMIKVMGGKAAQVPIQFASMSGSSHPNSSQGLKATLIKQSMPNQNTQSNTIIQTNKQTNNMYAIPMKQQVNVQSIRGPMVVPVSSVQLKSPVRQISGNSIELQNQNQNYINATRTSSNMNNPVVIRTQTGTLNNPQTVQYNQQHTVNVQQVQYQQPQTHQVQQQQQPQQAQHVQTPRTIQRQPMPPQVQHRYQVQPVQVNHTQVSSATPPKTLITSSILDHSGARKRHDIDFDYGVESKRRRSEKGSKGLRHFSTKVCEKVKAKGTTSYNEVADELVNEFSDSRCASPSETVNYDQKNIRRRVYDALNVLMAMNIISKEKKEIRWLGLPTNSAQDCRKLETEKRKKMETIKLKTQQLQDLILQQIAFKNLVERNRRAELVSGKPSPNSAIQLPFIIVNTSKKTVIDCSISNDKTEYLFNFDDTFEIHDDIEVLKRMGMALGLEKGECSQANIEKIKKMVPKALESYISDMSERVSDNKLPPNEESNDSLDMDLTRGKFPTASMAGTGSVTGTMSRHSSTGSLHNRPDTDSPLSFADDDYEEMEESDLDCS